MSMGHLALRGWDLSLDSFWTIDALFYALAVRIVGVHGELLTLVPSLIATAVVVRTRSRWSLRDRQAPRPAGLAAAAVVVAILALPVRQSRLLLPPGPVAHRHDPRLPRRVLGAFARPLSVERRSLGALAARSGTPRRHPDGCARSSPRSSPHRSSPRSADGGCSPALPASPPWRSASPLAAHHPSRLPRVRHVRDRDRVPAGAPETDPDQYRSHRLVGDQPPRPRRTPDDRDGQRGGPRRPHPYRRHRPRRRRCRSPLHRLLVAGCVGGRPEHGRAGTGGASTIAWSSACSPTARCSCSSPRTTTATTRATSPPG